MKTEMKDWISRRYFSISGQPIFEQFLKPELTELSLGNSTVSMRIGEEHLNAVRMVHGGVLASLADLAMGVACITYDKQVVTSDLHVTYIGNVGIGSTLKAVAKVLHNGKTLIRVSCAIFDETDRLLTSAFATFFVVGVLPKLAEMEPMAGL